jgi:hypothetical protein
MFDGVGQRVAHICSAVTAASVADREEDVMVLRFMMDQPAL